ncbi:MAG: hypothetical protein AAB370_11015 [Verrucomicrobiota bacterium]
MNNLPKFASWYVGTCTNTTSDITANLLLQIHGATETRVHGELGLFGNLAGGGPFHASLDSGTIRFTTCIPAIQVVIEWTGKRVGDRYSGSYQVTCDAPDPERGIMAREEGLWSCVQVNHLGHELESVFVFHDGETEGPLALEEFVQHATVDRWPPHALVARHDFKLWSTVEGCITELQSQTIGAN